MSELRIDHSTGVQYLYSYVRVRCEDVNDDWCVELSLRLNASPNPSVGVTKRFCLWFLSDDEPSRIKELVFDYDSESSSVIPYYVDRRSEEFPNNHNTTHLPMYSEGVCKVKLERMNDALQVHISIPKEEELFKFAIPKSFGCVMLGYENAISSDEHGTRSFGFKIDSVISSLDISRFTYVESSLNSKSCLFDIRKNFTFDLASAPGKRDRVTNGSHKNFSQRSTTQPDLKLPRTYSLGVSDSGNENRVSRSRFGCNPCFNFEFMLFIFTVTLILVSVLIFILNT